MHELFIGTSMPYRFLEWAKEECKFPVFYEFRVFENQDKAKQIIRGRDHLRIPVKLVFPQGCPISDTYLLFENSDEMIVFILIFGDTFPKYKPVKEKYGSIQRYSATNR